MNADRTNRETIQNDPNQVKVDMYSLLCAVGLEGDLRVLAEKVPVKGCCDVLNLFLFKKG